MISNGTTLLFIAALSASAIAQTASRPAHPAHRTSSTSTHSSPPAAPAPSAPACAQIPELSPKIPALPAGAPCAKPLYTVSTLPPAKLDYVSPLEGPDLRETLGLEGSSFSLNYIDVQVGTGPLAEPHKYYTIHYTGYLVDGTKFDSSYDHPGGEPITIAYGQHQVIPGWDTGFDGMHIGGKRRLFIPYQLAYGPTAHGPIPARSELIFDVELLSQSDTPPPPKTPAPAAGSANPAGNSSNPSAQPAKPQSSPQE